MLPLDYKAKNKDGFWTYGLPFFAVGNGEWFISHSNGWTPSYHNPDEGEYTVKTAVDPHTFCMNSGVKSRDGKDLYEHHFVQYHKPRASSEYGLFEVIYEDGMFFAGYHGGSSTTRKKKPLSGKLDIVGNRFDNPEMIPLLTY